jgi:predicted metalloprotease with PDZ domain
MRLFVFTALILSVTFVPGQSSSSFLVDLTRIKNDQFSVELMTPKIKSSTIVYNIPKTVPGTYSTDNYGYFVEDFKAYDAKGNELKTMRRNLNQWQIDNANRLNKVTYKVNDSFDDTTRREKIFEPAGTNIQPDTNYVINTHGLLGYFDGFQQSKCSLIVKHSAEMYGSTAMVDNDHSSILDVFVTASYNEMVDNPIMYCRPDTAILKVGGADVLISVFSPNRVIASGFLAKQLDTLLMAETKYLGGELPVKKYAFIIYLFDRPPLSRSAGALEHSHSSFYSLSEIAPQLFARRFSSVAAHEFFHILTPLNVHSEEIQYFDFINPKMSRHLWLYEGSTEYHAHLSQVQNKLTTVDDFLSEMGNKITISRRFYNDTLPFTFMSSHVLDSTYSRQYANVYEKGALIALCLDVKLLELSHGRYGILNLIKDLSKKYGKGKPFKDGELFNEIGRLTYPGITEFLDNFVAGNHPLPLAEVFQLVGVKWTPEYYTPLYNFGVSGLRNKQGQIYVQDDNVINEFGKKLGYQVGDTLVASNNIPISASSYLSVITSWRDKVKENDSLTITIKRKVGEEVKTIQLYAPVQKVDVKQYNKLSLDENATKDQVLLRNKWLNKSE